VNEIAGAPKTNIVIRISWCIIQIRCESPSVICIIPIATTEKGAARFD
jgi:hypothetical protein